MKKLERRIGLLSVVAISMGAMLGSGLFVLPGLASALTGPSVWLAYVVAGLCVLPAVLSKSELATAMPISGGTYVYVDRAFGPLLGTVMGLGLWLSLLLKSAFALVGFGAYLHVLADVNLKVIALILLAVVVGLNILGIRKVGTVQIAVVGLAIAGLVVVTVLGVPGFEQRRLEPAFEGGLVGFLSAVSFVHISFAGTTKATAFAEEIKNPGRNLPLGMIISLTLATTLYAGVTLVLVGNVPADQLDHDIHPIYTMARTVGGPIIGIGAAVLGVVTMTSMANAGILAASRFPFAMSRDDLVPRALGWVHQRFMTPAVSILATGSIMAAAITLLDIGRIAKLASSLMIVAFLSVNLAVLVLRESGLQWYKPTYLAPLYPWPQIAGIVVGVVLLWFMGLLGLIAVLAIAVPGLALFMTYGRGHTDRRGVFRQIGPRQDLRIEAAQRSGKHALARPITADGTPEEAAVVIPLFSHLQTPETLVEIGSALSDGGRVQVVHLTAIPEQTILDAMLDEDMVLSSLRRRVEATAEAQAIDAGFTAVVTRDIPHTVHDISIRVHCQWLVMQWQGRAARRFTLFNPLSWLVNHLSCNLALYKDAGIRYVREILVYPAPGPHDALVVSTADHLAGLYGANLTFVRFVPDQAPTITVQGEVDYLDQLRELCTGEATTSIVRGKNEIDAIAGVTAAYDLLVIGAASAPTRWQYLMGTPRDRLTRKAACSVLRLKTPPGRTHAVGPLRATTEGRRAPRLSDFIDPDAVGAQLAHTRKEALFSHFAAGLATVCGEVAPADIEAALWERERSQNTAVGRGLAMPHATLVAADSAYLAVFTTARPIAYQAPDDKPIDVFFVTLCPPSERNTHLEILGRLATLVVKTSLLERLRQVTTAEQIFEAFDECETQLDE